MSCQMTSQQQAYSRFAQFNSRAAHQPAVNIRTNNLSSKIQSSAGWGIVAHQTSVGNSRSTPDISWHQQLPTPHQLTLSATSGSLDNRGHHQLKRMATVYGRKETVAPKKATTDNYWAKISMKTALRKQHEAAALVKLRRGSFSKKQENKRR